MNLLQKIKDRKLKEVAQVKALVPTAALEKSQYFTAKPVSLVQYLARTDLKGIIAEFKRKSPSKGWIKQHAKAAEVTLGYMKAGASALSVLTDNTDFAGNNSDLTEARKFNFCPILRKDFIVDPYQIFEARAIGADVILLIAAILTPQEISDFSKLAHSLGLEVLLELHTELECRTSPVSEVDLLGVNSRNLDDLTVSFEKFEELAAVLKSEGKPLVAESGIKNSEEVKKLRELGFSGFLIGELFMSQPQPEVACRELVEEVEEFFYCKHLCVSA